MLGEKYNPTLIVNDEVAPRSTLDRMVAARFEMPDATLQGRKRFVVRITEKNRGEAFEISERSDYRRRTAWFGSSVTLCGACFSATENAAGSLAVRTHSVTVLPRAT